MTEDHLDVPVELGQQSDDRGLEGLQLGGALLRPTGRFAVALERTVLCSETASTCQKQDVRSRRAYGPISNGCK